MDDSSIELNVGWWKKPSPFTSNGAWQAEDEEFPGDFSAQSKPSILTSYIGVLHCYYQPCESIFAFYGTPPHADVKYVCRNHTEKAPESARFQATQFDRELKTRKKNSGV